MEIIDSEDETERLDNVEDTYEARPNPLELHPKKKSQKQP